jgi:hypothetical protein
MGQTNRVSAVLSAEDITAVNTAIGSINSKLPFLVDLSADEIKALPRFGDKSIAFVNKALELALQNDEFLPRSFNVDEFKKDVELYTKLYSILQPLRGLLEKVEDTYLEVGAEAYSAALVVYNSAKNSRQELTGLESVLDDLGKRFIMKSSPAEEKKTVQ